GEVAHERGELAHDAGARDRRVDLQRHVAPRRDRLERRYVHRKQLRLALLLVVDAALDDEDAIRHAELARLRVDGVEDDDLGAAGSPRSKIELWPARRSCCWRWPHASACSSTSSIPRRESPVESSAPHLTSDSSARLLAAEGSTRSQKSQIDVNSPPSSRAR